MKCKNRVDVATRGTCVIGTIITEPLRKNRKGYFFEVQ